MQRELHRWSSPAVGRDMDLLVFGRSGVRVIAFPSSTGRFSDWEEHGMVAAISEQLESNRLQLYCVDSLDAETWYAESRHPADRVKRANEYDRYLLEEVLPFSLKQNPNPIAVLAGASFGGYHAVNFGCRHPEHVSRILGMSGLYDIRRFTDGYYDESIYFHNPTDYLAHEHDSRRLEALKKLDIILAVGRDDPLRTSNERLSGILWSKGIWHALRIWDGWAHDWPIWQQMLRLYVEGHD